MGPGKASVCRCQKVILGPSSTSSLQGQWHVSLTGYSFSKALSISSKFILFIDLLSLSQAPFPLSCNLTKMYKWATKLIAPSDRGVPSSINQCKILWISLVSGLQTCSGSPLSIRGQAPGSPWLLDCHLFTNIAAYLFSYLRRVSGFKRRKTHQMREFVREFRDKGNRILV